MRTMLGLEASLSDSVGLRLSRALMRDLSCGCLERNLLSNVLAADCRATPAREVTLLDGGAFLREGVGPGLDAASVPGALDGSARSIIRFRNEMGVGSA